MNRLINRINKKIDKDPITKCWNWTGALGGKGYAKMRLHFNGEFKYIYVHRLMAYICLGFSFYSNNMVLHKCDNMKCVNPLHLFIGDNGSNMKDCFNKGRLTQGFKGRGDTRFRYSHSHYITKNMTDIKYN